jgi:hypothetical protein
MQENFRTAVFTHSRFHILEKQGKAQMRLANGGKTGDERGRVVRAEFSRSLQHGNSVRRLVRLERGFTGEKFAGEENPYQDPERN